MKELKEDKAKLEQVLFGLIKDFEEKHGVEIYDICISHDRTIGGYVKATLVDLDIRV